MNSEFHYYTTWFLAVKAGFASREAQRLSWACQYTDHHHRTLEIQTTTGHLTTLPTQNYSFWDETVIREAYVPFHFFPAGSGRSSVRTDGQTSAWDVRPNSPGVKQLLVAALKSHDLERIGIALHTFADSWAHQNFTARVDEFNRLDSSSPVPLPGHTQAGWQPDEWLTVWEDSRLVVPQVVNRTRFLDCAGKIFRYLCLYNATPYQGIESDVLAELEALVLAGQGRSTTEERMLEFVITYDMEPYDRDGPVTRYLDLPADEVLASPALDGLRKLGRDLWAKTGLSGPLAARAKPGFEESPFRNWLAAADTQREQARLILTGLPGIVW